jgi:hypothetical protein
VLLFQVGRPGSTSGRYLTDPPLRWRCSVVGPMVPSGWIAWLGGPTSGTAVVVLVATVDAAFFPGHGHRGRRAGVHAEVGPGDHPHLGTGRGRRAKWVRAPWRSGTRSTRCLYRRIFGASETCPLLLTFSVAPDS